MEGAIAMRFDDEEAGENLLKILALAHASGPQTITRNGSEAAVFVSIEEWRQILDLTSPDTLERSERGDTKS